MVNKITSAIESDDCDGNECLIDFQTDVNGNFYEFQCENILRDCCSRD